MEQTTDVADVPADPATTKPSIHPTKGRRFRVLDGDDGDVCIVNLVGEGHASFPLGTLLPIEGVPRFQSKTEAKKWVRNDSGDLLSGMQIMIFTAHEIYNINVVNKPTVQITAKPKRRVSGPAEE